MKRLSLLLLSLITSFFLILPSAFAMPILGEPPISLPLGEPPISLPILEEPEKPEQPVPEPAPVPTPPEEEEPQPEEPKPEPAPDEPKTDPVPQVPEEKVEKPKDSGESKETIRPRKAAEGGELPKTASPAPMGMLLGGLISLAGLGLSRIRR